MKRIVIASDGSADALAAAEFLARLPHSDSFEVAILSVTQDEQAFYRYAPQEWIDSHLEAMRSGAEQAFQQISPLFEGANVRIEHVVRSAPNIGPSIVEFANEWKSDLIVVGATGLSRISRMLLGSVSDYVATHARSSVLVVRPQKSTAESADSNADDDAASELRITLAYDDRSAAKYMLDEFLQVGWGNTVQVDIVTALGSTLSVYGDPPPDNYMIEQANRSVSAVVEQVAKVAPRTSGTLIYHSHAADGIVHFAEKHHSDLLVIGETKRNLVTRMLAGSVSRFVLRHAPCSVWIARNQATASHPNPEETVAAS